MKYSSISELFTAIANSIRGKTGSSDPIVAEDFPSVIGGIPSYEEGIQSEYDKFWDAFQKQQGQSGSMNCNFLFAGFGWSDENFKPKYIIRPKMAMQMFYYAQLGDLVSLLEASGSGLDTTVCYAFQNMFEYSGITRVPEISITVPSGESAIGAMFRNCKQLVEIQKIILGEGVVVAFNNVFTETIRLTTVTFEGTICRDINFQWSPLSVDSMKSVITHLKNYAGTADGAKYKVTFTDACWVALEADGSAPDGNTWRDYVETTLGWLT